MSQQRRTLETLEIAHPCQAPWDEMAGNDQVRFCPQCQLHVHNLSAMTRAEAEAVLQEKQARVCLGFTRGADGTILTQDRPPCPLGKRRKWVRWAVSLAGAALLGCLAIMT